MCSRSQNCFLSNSENFYIVNFFKLLNLDKPEKNFGVRSERSQK